MSNYGFWLPRFPPVCFEEVQNLDDTGKVLKLHSLATQKKKQQKIQKNKLKLELSESCLALKIPTISTTLSRTNYKDSVQSKPS